MDTEEAEALNKKYILAEDKTDVNTIRAWKHKRAMRDLKKATQAWDAMEIKEKERESPKDFQERSSTNQNVGVSHSTTQQNKKLGSSAMKMKRKEPTSVGNLKEEMKEHSISKDTLNSESEKPLKQSSSSSQQKEHTGKQPKEPLKKRQATAKSKIPDVQVNGGATNDEMDQFVSNYMSNKYGDSYWAWKDAEDMDDEIDGMEGNYSDVECDTDWCPTCGCEVPTQYL